MKEQLHQLLEIGTLRNVSIQVLPANGKAPDSLNGSLMLLETDEHEHLVYEEGQETGVLHSSPEMVSILTQRHGMIRAQTLDPEESAEFIRKVAEEL